MKYDLILVLHRDAILFLKKFVGKKTHMDFKNSDSNI